ncbi:hypothetical protein ACFYOY_47560 [Streptomyces sp. NPDC007875]|uniref:hypothetical protein n=1 Tax=Streptomyces sp. NPDC007875 TaxID=3364783 RepID=UPI0036A269C7
MNEELHTLLVALYVLLNDHVALSRACRGRQLLLSATPVPCGMSRETVKRSELAGHTDNGYYAAGPQAQS